MFEYEPITPVVSMNSVSLEQGATVSDVTFTGPGGEEVAAYLVTGRGPARAGVVYLHQYGGGRDRTQFLDEGVRLAAEGVASIHVQGRFPWATLPSDLAHDRQEIIRQVVTLRQAIDVLVSTAGADPAAIGFVGHDYGAMYGALLVGVEDRIKAAVLMTPHPRFADWFLAYWHSTLDDKDAYRDGLADLDPARFVARAAPTELLFQFGESDRFVSEADARELFDAASQPKEQRYYPAGHRLNDEAAEERVRWMLDALISD